MGQKKATKNQISQKSYWSSHRDERQSRSSGWPSQPTLGRPSTQKKNSEKWAWKLHNSFPFAAFADSSFVQYKRLRHLGKKQLENTVEVFSDHIYLGRQIFVSSTLQALAHTQVLSESLEYTLDVGLNQRHTQSSKGYNIALNQRWR